MPTAAVLVTNELDEMKFFRAMSRSTRLQLSPLIAVLNELMLTEEEYVARLNALLSVYVNPLRIFAEHGKTTIILSADDVDSTIAHFF